MANLRYWEKHEVSGSELLAMRMMRGKTAADMSRIAYKKGFHGYDSHLFRFYEKEPAPIPLDIVEFYMTQLGITASHMRQFQKIMRGETKVFNEGRTIAPSIKKEVKKKCNNKCVRCGEKKKLHFHHIERFSEGGQSTVENLILLCAACHAEEHKGEQAYHMLKKQAEGEI